MRTGTVSHLSVLTHNVNGLNAPPKGHRLKEWVKNQNSTICCQQETHTTGRDS